MTTIAQYVDVHFYILFGSYFIRSVCVLCMFSSAQHSTLTGINQCVGLHNERHFVMFMFVFIIQLSVFPLRDIFQGIRHVSYLLLCGFWLAPFIHGSGISI
jgi:hypothetical protein